MLYIYDNVAKVAHQFRPTAGGIDTRYTACGIYVDTLQPADTFLDWEVEHAALTLCTACAS